MTTARKPVKRPAAAEATIRPARPADAAALGRLGAELARLHHGWDAERFFLPAADLEQGYAWWLGKELANPQAVVLSALRGRKLVGYAYGRIEPRDWNALRDRCGAAIDLFVSPEARGQDLGRRLTEALSAALAEKGAPRIVLQTAAKNRVGQRLFRALGFRPTMLELTREAAAPAAPGSGPATRARPKARRRGRLT